jgi:hypothetical protein
MTDLTGSFLQILVLNAPRLVSARENIPNAFLLKNITMYKVKVVPGTLTPRHADVIRSGGRAPHKFNLGTR